MKSQFGNFINKKDVSGIVDIFFRILTKIYKAYVYKAFPRVSNGS